ncbi:uncharacterized protein EV422DRAFT_541984 [Fimicolochytrium jonesii]|uniref:uncharacterized protein n=1 Tax=Fimicolochytrium jonesii TaxID=1396493 RepID=UPI0022FDB8A7|nr:uncharacterized protein EV422DRAFT_541984 [Fimicolochytrium jonesii]KAI8817227.1 hypothetical protein EV422DRAFT_541984 [Fimicolochytrium jonesii]
MKGDDETEGGVAGPTATTTTTGATAPTGPSSVGGPAAAAPRRKKKPAAPEKPLPPTPLTPDQKTEIATRELEELKDEIEKQKEEWARVLDNFKAEMEEMDVRLGEVAREYYEFRRDIVGGAVNQRTGKVVSERVVRWFEERIRGKDALIKKTRLKNSTLKLQKNKLHQQLKQKEEMGEVLHAIDFDQLQIENKQYLAKIEERNAELLKLKMTAGNTMQVLNHHKTKLHALTTDSHHLRSEIAQRQDLLSKLISEAEIVEAERAAAEKVNRRIKGEMEDYRVPDVMDYVSLNAQQEELHQKLTMWQRKVEIAAMQNTRLRNIWRRMSTPHDRLPPYTPTHNAPTLQAQWRADERVARGRSLPPLAG